MGERRSTLVRMGVTPVSVTVPSGAAPASDAWARTTVVAVTHNSGHVIGACLDSVRPAARILIIDNASHDDCLAIVAATVPGVEVVRNTVGLGYGNGVNQGLEKVETEFALLINPDATLEPGALESLVEEADRYPQAGILAPTIRNPDGDIELSHDAGLFQRARLPVDRMGETAPEGPCCADFLSGAVTLMRMAALRDAGFYDPAIFLYYEDDDICLRLRAAGYALILVPEAVARHRGGGSVKPGWQSHWEKFFHMAWSRLYIEAKYGEPTGPTRLGWLNVARYGVKALGYGLLFNPKKAVRDGARCAGTLAYLMGRPASRTTRRARPEGVSR